MHDWREEIAYLLIIVVLLLATFIVALFIERCKKKEKDSAPAKMTEYVPLPSTMRPPLTQHQAELAAYAMQRALNECKERTSDDPFFQKVNESMCREIEAAMDKLCRIAGIYLETHSGDENCHEETTNTACPGEHGGWRIGQKVRLKSRPDVGVCGIHEFTDNGVIVKGMEKVIIAHVFLSEIEKVED